MRFRKLSTRTIEIQSYVTVRSAWPAERLAQGYKVKAGYTTTHNRAYRDKWILTKSK